jgi:hypothetical protein
LSSYLCRVDALKQLKKEKEREGAKKKKRERVFFHGHGERDLSAR